MRRGRPPSYTVSVLYIKGIGITFSIIYKLFRSRKYIRFQSPKVDCNLSIFSPVLFKEKNKIYKLKKIILKGRKGFKGEGGEPLHFPALNPKG